jgi:omega-amidase
LLLDLVQYDPVWEDKTRNREKLSWLLENNFKGSDLLIFPEMTLTGFTMNASKFAESIDGEGFEYFSSLASTYKSGVIAGIIEKEKDYFFNTLLYIDKEGRLAAKYRKIHPFSYSTENKYYKRGGKPVSTNVDGWNVGLSICYDLRFPELYRLYGKDRCELIINIANWPVTRIEHWKALCKARAIENQCYFAGVNRVGKDLKLEYNGFCCIIDPMGNEIISAYDEEKILSAEITKDTVTEIRKNLPFLDDIFLI